jgi:hypothetical protein
VRFIAWLQCASPVPCLFRCLHRLSPKSCSFHF